MLSKLLSCSFCSLLLWMFVAPQAVCGEADPVGPEQQGEGRRCAYQIGWTRDVRGGLDGDIIKVTTLAGSGPGSLREALAASGPRVVVFEVGGVIDLAGSGLDILEPFVTVAGQTAPAPGITLIRGSLTIRTHDVVVQHLAVRPGAGGQPIGWEPDGISLSAAHDVIVDHCSTSWAVDENLSASGPRFDGATPEEWRANTSHRVTFSNNIVAEALSHATHAKGEHSKGSLIHDNVTDILVYRNLYASNVDRNPMFKGGARGAVVNNFIINPKSFAMSYVLVSEEWMGMPHQPGMMSIVGNVLQHGLDTSWVVGLLFAWGPLYVYFDDNLASSLSGNPVPWLGGFLLDVTQLDAPPTWPEGLEASASEGIVASVTEDVGARPWDRHATDARIIAEALAGTTRLIDSEEEVGGYPPLEPATSESFDPTAWDSCFEPIPPLTFHVDIKPGNDPNSIDPFSRGVIPVAILTTEDFDAMAVDTDSVLFGPAEVEKRHKSAHVEDADGDGDLDLVLHFRTRDTGIALGDTEACVIGQTYDGVPLMGCDSVRTVPPS